MADIVGSKLITEEELDSITLRATMEEILGNYLKFKFLIFFFFLSFVTLCWFQIIGNEELMTEMSERAFKAAKPDAASDVAKHIISIVKSKYK